MPPPVAAGAHHSPAVAVVATGESVAAARDAAYEGVARVRSDGAQYGTDVAAGI